MGVWHLLVVEVLVPRLCLDAKLRGTQPPEDLEAVPAIPKYEKYFSSGLKLHTVPVCPCVAGLATPVLRYRHLFFLNPTASNPREGARN